MRTARAARGLFDTADAVAGAAMRAGIHYVDVCAEQETARTTLKKFEEPARQAGVAPRGQGPIGGAMAVRGEPFEHPEMLQDRRDRGRHRLADTDAVRRRTVDQANGQLGRKVRKRDRRGAAGRPGPYDGDVEIGQ